MAAVIADFGKIDILVNSAGIARLAPAEELSLADWDSTIAVNLKGTFLMCQAVGRHMLAAGRGAIINMASQAASVAIDEHVAYCASKFGVVGITKVLATEWAGRGVRVNSISPTVVLTDLGIKAWDNPKGDALKKLIPTGRFAYPNEIAAAAIYLASRRRGHGQRGRPASSTAATPSSSGRGAGHQLRTEHHVAGLGLRRLGRGHQQVDGRGPDVRAGLADRRQRHRRRAGEVDVVVADQRDVVRARSLRCRPSACSIPIASRSLAQNTASGR